MSIILRYSTDGRVWHLHTGDNNRITMEQRTIDTCFGALDISSIVAPEVSPSLRSMSLPNKILRMLKLVCIVNILLFYCLTWVHASSTLFRLDDIRIRLARVHYMLSPFQRFCYIPWKYSRLYCSKASCKLKIFGREYIPDCTLWQLRTQITIE